MSVRKRVWKNAKGEAKEAWVADYRDGAGTRRFKTFKLKKQADNFAATTHVEIAKGIHTADSASIKVAEAADKWLAACRMPACDQEEPLEASTIASYEQQVRLHIVPFLGRLKLSQLTAISITDFQRQLREAGRSASKVRRVTRILGTLIGFAQEQCYVSHNVVRERSRRKVSKKKHESRHEGHVERGRDYPSPDEIAASLRRWRGAGGQSC